MRFAKRLALFAPYPALCWEWPGHRGKGGYVEVSIYPSGRQRGRMAHVRVYEHLIGPVPAGLQLDHLCRNPRCVNPAHMEPVTARENVMRSAGVAAENARKETCLRGHPLEGKNLRKDARAWRLCRQCTREKDRERKKELRRARGLKRLPNYIPPLQPLQV